MQLWEITRVGEVAILLRPAEWTPETGAAMARSLGSLPGVLSAIPGYDSIYLVTEREIGEDELITALQTGDERGSSPARHVLRLDVSPASGPDVDRFIELKRMTEPQLREQLAGAHLRVRHLGFVPGFAYLEGLSSSFDVPRLSRPRERVPAGSFGVAAGLAGFYPTESPGGWWLLGRTDATLWDERRDPPNLLAPGDHVRLELCERTELGNPEREPEPSPSGAPLGTVSNPGTFTISVEATADWGLMKSGRYAGGAFDPERAAAANRAVGNSEKARVLEIYDRGPSIRLETAALFSWYGEGQVTRDGQPVFTPRQFEAGAGTTLRIDSSPREARGWLAVRGGFSALPSPLRAGVELTIDGADGRPRIGAVDRSDRSVVRVAAGPTIVPEAVEELTSTAWRLTEAANRTGARFKPVRTVGALSPEWSSSGAQPGTVQWTPEGELIVLGPEHPVTGGYPQPFTLLREELWKIGSLRPEEEITFRLVRHAICSEVTA